MSRTPGSPKPSSTGRGSSIWISSNMDSRKAFIRSSPRLRAVCAMVAFCTR